MLAMPTIPAWAAGSDSAPISMASVRSFPKRPIPHRSFSEAVSTDVDGSWGGIETLDVPHTESPEEQATRIQADRRMGCNESERTNPLAETGRRNFRHHLEARELTKENRVDIT